jgi:hypothetical protein
MRSWTMGFPGSTHLFLPQMLISDVNFMKHGWFWDCSNLKCVFFVAWFGPLSDHLFLGFTTKVAGMFATHTYTHTLMGISRVLTLRVMSSLGRVVSLKLKHVPYVLREIMFLGQTWADYPKNHWHCRF